jgi:light-harvesting complex 1 beta chain
MSETQGNPVAMPSGDRSFGSRGVFAASFIVVLVIALAAQSMFLNWRPWFPGAEGERSLIRGVTAAVYTFMSYIE